jgi:MoaA/NifB/PqqE/SkfB family radical SAM enzyme
MLPTIELPSYIQLEPVGQCNLRCQMCPIQFRTDGPPHGPPAFMDWSLFTRVLDDLPTLTELHLQGLGEPMMHPCFFDMIEYAVKRGISVTTNSNVTLLNAERARRCVTSGLSTLHVSLDAATPETYERIRVRAHHDRVLRNLGHLRDAKRELASETPRLRLVMVLMRQNLDELPALVRLAASYEINAMFVQHLCHDFGESTLPAHYAPMRQFVNEQTLIGYDPAHVARVFEEAAGIATAAGIELRLPRVEPREHASGTPGPKRCDWPWHGPYLSFAGDSMPCCMIATPDRGNFGRVSADADGESVADIWKGPKYQAFRAALASDTPPEVCKSCSVYRGVF